MDESLNPLLNADEVAAILRISRITVYRLVKRGVLKVRRVGNKMRFEREAVLNFINSLGESA